MARNVPKKARTTTPSTSEPAGSHKPVSNRITGAQTGNVKGIWEIGADGVNPCYIESVPAEILDIVIALVITNSTPTRSRRGLKIDRTVHPGFMSPPVDKIARHRLRSVCRTWAKIIDATLREIHFDGDRAPGPMLESNEDSETEEEIRPSALIDENGDEIISDEVRRTRVDLERIPAGVPINLTLIKPRYDADPGGVKDSGRPGAGLMRPGVLDMVNSAPKSDIASLTIIDDCDIAWVQRLLDDEGEPTDHRWQDENMTQANAIIKSFHDVYEKMCARQLQPPKLCRTRWQIRRQVALAKKEDEKAWKKLHTLRLMFSGRDSYDTTFAQLSPLKFPALRCVELHLHRYEPLHLWVLPYSQITHLTLGSDTSSFILLSILKLTRLSLESLSVRLLSDRQDWGHSGKYERTESCIDFPKLGVLRLYRKTTEENVEQFLNALKCPNLQTFDITTETYGNGSLTPAARFIKRSGCTLRELYIDTEDHCSPSDSMALETIMRDHSGALEAFHLHGGLFLFDWLDGFTAPRLTEVDFLCFGINEWNIDQLPERNPAPEAKDFALRLFRWIQDWAASKSLLDTQDFKSRHSQLAVRFCAAPDCYPGHYQYYDTNRHSLLAAVSPPRAIESIQNELLGAGMKVEVEWWVHKWDVPAYNAKRLSNEEKTDTSQ
ncbi:hypothetical protein DFP72DRAFT_921228 [Ephemerocybe angulata]|uniref:Uncharacterized protein n=1 Tax=Ephemerocybe angulata TaxID=980116 RepID=A0A8H6HH65_9AGAR|nr:hypothetical protein DFP72DRAFT_921228 [Tulosesus angulatus]